MYLYLHGIAEGGVPHHPQSHPGHKAHLTETLKHRTVPETAQDPGLVAGLQTV